MRRTENIIKTSKRRHGGVMIMMLGVTVIIALLTMFYLEVNTMYETQYAIEVRTQRALNSTVEYAMDDEWRKDGFNYMNVEVAQAVLYNNLISDLDLDGGFRCTSSTGETIYSVAFSNIRFYSGNPDDGGTEPAGIEMDVTVTMNVADGLFGQTVTWTQHFKSTNFRTDNNLRAGVRP